MRFRVLVMTLFALGASQAAAADDDVMSELESKPNAFYAQGGLGTPLGYVGFELARRVSPSFLVSAGAGMGVTGPQITLMPRLLLGQGRSVLVLGAGVSRGKYTSNTHCFDDDSCAHLVGTANWANAEESAANTGGPAASPSGTSGATDGPSPTISSAPATPSTNATRTPAGAGASSTPASRSARRSRTSNQAGRGSCR